MQPTEGEVFSFLTFGSVLHFCVLCRRRTLSADPVGGPCRRTQNGPKTDPKHKIVEDPGHKTIYRGGPGTQNEKMSP